MNEVDDYLQSENSSKLSSIMQAQAGKEIYPSLITRLNQILSK